MRRMTWLGAVCLAGGAAGIPLLLATAEPEAPAATPTAATADHAEEEAAGDRPAEAAALLEQARLFAERGEEDGAADLYRQAAARFPEDRPHLAAALVHLQAYHTRRQERAEAQHYHVRRVALDPADPRPHADWAHAVLFGFQDFDAAIPAARRALAIADDAAVRRDLAMALYARWAYLLIARRERAAAQLHFAEAQTLMPDLKDVVRQARGRPVMDFAVLAITQPQSPVVTGRLATVPPR